MSPLLRFVPGTAQRGKRRALLQASSISPKRQRFEGHSDMEIANDLATITARLDAAATRYQNLNETYCQMNSQYSDIQLKMNLISNQKVTFYIYVCKYS